MTRSAHEPPLPFAVRRALLTSRMGLFSSLLLAVRAWRKRVRLVRRKACEVFTFRDIFDGQWPYWEAPQPEWRVGTAPRSGP